MIKKLITGFSIMIGSAMILFGGALTVNAVTVEDVWNEARAYGWPEEMIQDYYNLARAEYTDESDWNDENLQKAIDAIHENGQYCITTGPQVTQPVVTTTTTASADPDVPGTSAP